MDIEKGVFPENGEMGTFLESPFARQAYIEGYPIPWIMTHSVAECKTALLNPPDEIVEGTNRIVAMMASGGLHLPASYCTVEEDKEKTREAEKICRDVHLATTDISVMKTYDVKKLKVIKGAYRETASGQPTRLQVLTDAVELWPHFLQFKATRGGGFHRLDVDLVSMETLMDKHGGMASFGGGYCQWQSVWDCKEVLGGDIADDDLDNEVSVISSSEPAGTPVEHFNYTVAKEHLDDGRMDKPDYVEAYLYNCTRLGGDMAKRIVEYYRKHNLPGRRLATCPAGQWMTTSNKKCLLYGGTCVCRWWKGIRQH